MTREPIRYAIVGGPPDDWQNLEVTLDGQTLSAVIEANADEGWARIYAHDDAGHILLGPDNAPSILTLSGKVAINRRRVMGLGLPGQPRSVTMRREGNDLVLHFTDPARLGAFWDRLLAEGVHGGD